MGKTDDRGGVMDIEKLKSELQNFIDGRYPYASPERSLCARSLELIQHLQDRIGNAEAKLAAMESQKPSAYTDQHGHLNGTGKAIPPNTFLYAKPVPADKPAVAVPVQLNCPQCGSAHIDEGEWATRLHKTHQCQTCKHEWRPFDYPTVGVPPAVATMESQELEPYDAGCLNDFGGGNVGWWHDYIRSELGRAHDHYAEQFNVPVNNPAVAVPEPEPRKCCGNPVMDDGYVCCGDYLYGDDAMLAAAPSHSQQSDAVDLLRQIFELYEDGVDCYENPDEGAGYLGKAFRIDHDTYKLCVELLDSSEDRCPSHESEQLQTLRAHGLAENQQTEGD